MKSILLVDDHRTFLAGTAFILEKYGYRVTTAAKAADALRLMEEAPFDLFVIDLKLPESSGFELAEAILRSFPEAIVVVLTGEDIAEHFDHLLALGVTAVLEKALGEEELAASLRLAEQRLTVLPVELARRLRATGSPADGGAGPTGPALSERELAVLQLIADGSKNKDIADRLFMSQRNVEYLLSGLFRKLGVQSRQEAVLKAVQEQWIRLGSP
ncbi:response regulator transcription factor [Paenibacillus aurantius]|uniref:Response regulator transcription factor n=1 Tax=Paenibacillus aurantius TaxID=2918900 RepID=A0AA96RED9_9BACL|nr:response regulator transcription factor [Paenibacillus aurantius]WNQ12340.1 response regulator transcription factor [Paenibacillus aurantius]